jgi:hypothetical protein
MLLLLLLRRSRYIPSAEARKTVPAGRLATLEVTRKDVVSGREVLFHVVDSVAKLTKNDW